MPTILGELRRHFRDGCWMVRPRRRIQELQARITATTDRFVQKHGRFHGPTELAEQLSTPLQEIREARAADGCLRPSSLDRPLGSISRIDLGDTLGDDAPEFDHIDTHLALRPLLDDLPGWGHRVIELRYF